MSLDPDIRVSVTATPRVNAVVKAAKHISVSVAPAEIHVVGTAALGPRGPAGPTGDPGPTGDQGPPGDPGNDGRTPDFAGDWFPGVEYWPSAIVRHEDASYGSRGFPPVGTEPTTGGADDPWWQLVAEDGAPGTGGGGGAGAQPYFRVPFETAPGDNLGGGSVQALRFPTMANSIVLPGSAFVYGPPPFGRTCIIPQQDGIYLISGTVLTGTLLSRCRLVIGTLDTGETWWEDEASPNFQDNAALVPPLQMTFEPKLKFSFPYPILAGTQVAVIMNVQQPTNVYCAISTFFMTRLGDIPA